MRSSVLFWYRRISRRATVPGRYFLVFLFFLPAWRNSFRGALPPTVGRSFLLTGSSSPEADGPASAAIWANCRVGDDDGDLPTSSSRLASSTRLSASSNLSCCSTSLAGEGSLTGDGWCTGEAGLRPFSARSFLSLLERSTHLSRPLSFLGVTFVLAILQRIWRTLASNKTVKLCSREILPSGHFEFKIR